MISSSDSFLLCPSCDGLNAPDSKFCRHCGKTLEGANGVTAATLAPEVPAPEVPAPEAIAPENALHMPGDLLPAVAASEAVTPVAEEVAAEEKTALSSPAEIDSRRARQLLERAQSLSERNDTAGAILASRQAIALAPTIAGGHAMLGALLERSGDLTHAVAAFERAAQLAPESDAARDLARLRDKMGAPTDAPMFHFDDAELFGDDNAPAPLPLASAAAALIPTPATSAPPVVEAAAATPAAPAEPLANAGALPAPIQEAAFTEVPATPEPSLASQSAPAEIALIETAQSDSVPSIAAALPPTRERRVASVPVRVERRVSISPSVLAPGVAAGTPVGARVKAPAAASPVANPILMADSAPKPPGWSAWWAQPSYFGRSLPLIGATVLALGFLSWARGLADARNLANAPAPVVAQVQSQVQTPEVLPADVAPINNATGTNPPPLAPVGSAPVPNSGFPISNQPIARPGVAPPAIAQSSAPVAPSQRAVAARPAPAAPGAGRAPRNPRTNTRSPQVIAPAPIPAPGPRPTTARGSGDFTLPAPVIAAPAPAAPATSVLPGNSAPPLNPSGSAGRGYVRITQGRVGTSALPQRPAARAAEAERAAARGGSTSAAIDGLTASINANSSEAGYRYQQRATLFLQQRDFGRAADDFQAAISAYNDQINRGEQVASARAGLRAARSGLNLALAEGR